jgi:hypothetical protein
LNVLATVHDVDFSTNEERELFFVRYHDLTVFVSASFEDAFLYWRGFTSAISYCRED